MPIENGSNIERRPYQRKGRSAIISAVRDYLNDNMTQKENIALPTSIPLWMATGSGKTYTIGEALNKIFNLRNKYHPEISIKILVLNDRISLVNQFERDFRGGRDGKPGFLAEHPLHTKIYHSKTKNNNDIQNEVQDNKNSSKDEIHFATLQTAQTKELYQTIQPNIIIVDEAHILTWSERYDTLMKFYRPDENGRLPLVFLLSATMSPILHLINDPIITFGLAEYIASPYCPQVHYHLVTTNSRNQSEIDAIEQEIVRITEIEQLESKKAAIEQCKTNLEIQLKKTSMTNEDLIWDMLTRIKDRDHTIVFVNSIDSADKIASLINTQTNDPNTAVAIHSQIDETDESILDKYKDGTHKIIVAVNKLNQGIDLPQTKNVVFRRDTESDIIFQQQFGRWLRWDEVHIYDYVWGLRNLARIKGIYHAVDDIHKTKKDENPDDENHDNKKDDTQEGKNIDIDIQTMNSIDSNSTQINIENLLQQIQNIETSLHISDEKMIDDLRTELAKKGITNRKTLVEYNLKKFKDAFWISIIKKILDRPKLKQLWTQDLEDLSDKLWFESYEVWLKKELAMTVYTNRKKVFKRGITSRETLMEYGCTEFQNTFWTRIIKKILVGKILDRPKTKISTQDLEDLSDKLWFESYEVWFKKELEKEGTTNREKLVEYNIRKFQNTFWTSIVAKILDRQIDTIYIKDLEDLSDKLWFESYEVWLKKELTEQVYTNRKKVSKRGITTRKELVIECGAKEFQSTFWTSIVKKILDRPTLKQLSTQDLEDLSDKLWFESYNIWFKKELEEKSITNRETLVGYGARNFKDVFWTSIIKKILDIDEGLTSISIKDLEELSDILRPESSS
jgi:superfamily II DNA or RNA helicase